jgi:DNA modification methylase
MTFEEIMGRLPKPYYADDAVAIYCADCRDILPLIPDKSIDLVLTDPPYGVNLDLTWLSELNVAHSKPANRLDKPVIGDEGMALDWLFNYSRWVVFGFPYVFSVKATGWLAWDKQPGLMNTDRTMTTPIEMALTNCWKGFRLVRCMWAGYMRDNGEYRFRHPTQKPQKVVNYCLNKASAVHDLILDPFLGSGTTAFCAKKLGRKCIGIEIEEKYCEIAAKRCSQMVMRLRMTFEEIVGKGRDNGNAFRLCTVSQL